MLTGRDYSDVEGDLAAWSALEDPPLYRSGRIWRLVSKDDTWNLLSPLITRTHLSRFHELAHGGYAHAGRSAEADVTSSSEEKLGDRFSTACPLSVVLGPWSPLWTCRTGLSGHGGSPPPRLDNLLNCNVALVVQRTGRRGRLRFLVRPDDGADLPRSVRLR